eukprot:CAMPEP_0183715174 /NCGR_PEP_ID=MMETSP0737-20130205/9512_1 /TAXON_ID=385413 /ORGANISM="Thalassiosira miniscula, Strain CCMP1093" /LENGTH=1373 /DNA_ID=CAMNT_0025944259 /DNA_START=219 /DNA_END=4340 /DNA_ORIENTATION=+
MKNASSSSSSSSSSILTLTIILFITILLLLQPTSISAGLTVGGVTSTAKCYTALQNARESLTSNRVTKEGYVNFISELSNGAFTALMQNPENPAEWGMFPVTQFEQLPTLVKQEFYTHACGGPYIICTEAYLYTDGSGNGENPNPQQTVYLFEVCLGIEEAIDESTPKPAPTPPVTPSPTTPDTPGPTTSQPIASAQSFPSYNPTPSPIDGIYNGIESLELTYHALVTGDMSTAEMQSLNSLHRQQLLGAMTSWSFRTSREYDTREITQQGDDAESQGLDEELAMETSRKRIGEVRLLNRETGEGRRRRDLRVTPLPMQEDEMGEEYMTVVDVECDGETAATKQDTDHCIAVTTELPLQFINEPTESKEEALAFFTANFDRDLLDGTFRSLINPEETRLMVKGVYPVPIPGSELVPLDPNDDGGDNDKPKPGGIPIVGPQIPVGGVPTAKPSPDLKAILEGIDQNRAAAAEEEGGKASAGGIAAGVVVSVISISALGFFVWRRRKNSYGSDISSKSSSGYDKKEFDPFDDLEGGRKKASRSGSSGSSYSSSSRDEFSSGDSQSSGSMQSFSGSDSSSRSSRSSASGSYTSRSSRSSRSSSYYSSSFSTSRSGTNSKEDSKNSSSNSGKGSADSPHEKDGGAAAVQRLDSEGSSTLFSAQNSHGSSVGEASDPQRATASKGEGSSHGGSSYSSNGGPFRTNVDLMDTAADNAGTDTEVSKGTATGDDDSSAGSSGWESSDGDSSADTGSVDSYDPNQLGSSVTSSTDNKDSGTLTSYTSSSDEKTASSEQYMNPAVNPVVQHNVTMLPIEETSEREEDTEVSSDSESTGIRRDNAPRGSDIHDAIEKGDWAAVGATAAILADDGTRDTTGSVLSDLLSTGTGNEDDDARAAEIDQLVETGNWDGVVAVAARYADEADEADSELSPNRSSKSGTRSTNDTLKSSSRSHSSGSGGSVSIETADASSVFSNTTRDSMSHTTYSVDTSRDSAYSNETSHDEASTVTGASRSVGTDSRTPSGSGGSREANTQSSSITSSYVSASGITSSMISAVSSLDVNERKQMNAYRAEVEALVRRVVPDEIDNVDDIMVQFSGREEELIETLRSMQEKSIAQRARAAVQRSAKKEAGRTGRQHDDSSEDLLGHSLGTDGQSVTTDGQSETTDGQYTSGQSETTDGQYTAHTRSDAGSYSSRGSGSYSRTTTSFTKDFTEGDDYSSSSGSSGSRSDSGSDSVSSYSSGSSGSQSGQSSISGFSKDSGSILSQLDADKSIGVISIGKSSDGDDRIEMSPNLVDAIKSSDWRAVREASELIQETSRSQSTPPKSARSLLTGVSEMDSEDDLDNMIDQGDWGGIISAASGMQGGHVHRDSSSDDGIGNID